MLWVLQEPVEESKLNSSLSMVTNNLIDLYNEAAMDVSRYANLNIFNKYFFTLLLLFIELNVFFS